MGEKQAPGSLIGRRRRSASASHGRESRWPPRLQLERQLRGWPGTGDRDDVLRVLQQLRGVHAGDAALIASLRRTFAADRETLEQALWLLEHGSVRTMTDSDADEWLTAEGIAHTRAGENQDGTPVYTVGFNAAGTGVTLRFGLMEPNIPPPERRGRAAGEHAVTARTAAGIVRFMRWLSGQQVTVLHHLGMDQGTHAQERYCIDVQGFTFADGTRVILSGARAESGWHGAATAPGAHGPTQGVVLPTGETPQAFLLRVGNWLAATDFGQVLGPGIGAGGHHNHFHVQVPPGTRFRGFQHTEPQSSTSRPTPASSAAR